ncbi:LolA family protein [Aliivibrio fischeri]|uniref:LolA family protein n=1 Tax=Aliivibrio fischeri TaxID=668 RepID=UPI0012DA4AE5|nr:outer membrane lipoprotein carrier protein LolA [Aliivibrio fischeri]MUK71335.1 outer membrane lipoprotein carrier protein LolA [Aliivibrio fischeri]MUK74630.1 outer membrane lipoprotein carrier protein LolA [Aliivibrio fischeri]
MLNVKRYWSLLVASFVMLFSVNSFAFSVDDLQQQLAKSTLVRGDFKQVRTMQMFAQPLSTTGTFLLDHEKGLLWQQTEPFPIALTLTQNNLRQSINGEAQVMTDSDNPMAFYFTRLFLSLFKGDTESIKENFTLQLTGEKDAWTLILTPTKAPIDSVFKTIKIEGNDYLNRVVLSEVRGDVTEMVFTNQSTEPATLTEEELRVFEF